MVEKMELDLYSTFNPAIIRDEMKMILGESSSSTNNNQTIEETQVVELQPRRITHGSHGSIYPERQVEANIWNLMH